MIVYVDLDEVIADFVGAALRLHGWELEEFLRLHTLGEWGMAPTMGISNNQFWRPINLMGERFWKNLDTLPWAHNVVDTLKELEVEWYVVTTPSNDPGSYSGKVHWIQGFFGSNFDNFFLTKHKSKLANPDSVLIDDKPGNVSSFTEAGGQGILFPTWGNCLHELRADPVSYVEKELKKLCT
jgi:5'(3')-deoxyribonucleotidase